MRRLLTLALLAACATPPSEPAPRTSPVAEGVDAFATATLQEGKTPSLQIAVMRGTEMLVNRGYGFADADARVLATAQTRYRIASLSKQMVAAAIMRLVEQGKMRVEDPVTKYLPELAGYADKVTIHHLLTHTSGLAGGVEWDPNLTRIVPPEEVIRRYRERPVVAAPGERYAYNNGAYFVLGHVIERVTGESYPEHFRKTFFQPLGMTDTVYCEEPPPVPNRARGYVYDEGAGFSSEPTMNMSVVGAGGSFCSTVGDLLKWQRALIGGRIVSPQSYAKMTTPVVLNDGTTEPYGYGLGIRPVDGVHAISHGGGIISFWSYLSYYPQHDLHIAVLINSGGLPSRPFAEELARRVFKALP